MVRMHEMTEKKRANEEMTDQRQWQKAPRVPRGMGSRSQKSPMNRIILRKILKNAEKKNDSKLPNEYHINYSTLQILKSYEKY